MTGLSRNTWQRGKIPGEQLPCFLRPYQPIPSQRSYARFTSVGSPGRGRLGGLSSALPVFSLPPWASQRLSLHIYQRGRLKLLFTGKFQGTIDQFSGSAPRPQAKCKCYIQSELPALLAVLLRGGQGSTWQGSVQASFAQACCLEYKCE